MADYKDHIGPYWPGYPGIANLVIFGDSYSSIGYPNFYPRPDKDHPLGSPLPAYVWTESQDKPNWVGHLVAKHKANPDLLVYNYAVGGDDVQALEAQVKKRFLLHLLHVGKQPDWAPWKSNDTLFVTWVGINDCANLNSGYARIEETQKKTFQPSTGALRQRRSELLVHRCPTDRKISRIPEGRWAIGWSGLRKME